MRGRVIVNELALDRVVTTSKHARRRLLPWRKGGLRFSLGAETAEHRVGLVHLVRSAEELYSLSSMHTADTVAVDGLAVLKTRNDVAQNPK